MKSFLGSNTTRFLIGTLVAYLLLALAPMLRDHAIDWWKLAEVLVVQGAALLVNALRPDVNAPGLNWFGPKVPKQ